MKIVFLNSHPIAYKSDMYRYLSNKTSIEVWYCSKYGLKSHFDKEFNTYRSLDGLINGFDHKFLINLMPNSSAREKFFDSINPSIFLELLKLRKGDLIICHGWSRLTMLIVLVFARTLGIRLGLRAETPITHEYNYSGLKKIVRRFILKNIFKRVDYFFYIGTNNKEFYLSMGVPEDKFVFMPYSCKPKNIEFYEANFNQKIIFCGKLIEKKRPLDLLLAFSKIKHKKVELVFAGDGEQKEELIDKSIELKINNRVKFLGLLTPEKLEKHYKSSDLLVLPSGYGETWGLVINEALEHSLPVIISSRVGSSIDLCNENGYIFKYGDIKDLKEKIDEFYDLPLRDLNLLRKKSSEIKDKFSFQTIQDNLLNLIA